MFEQKFIEKLRALLPWQEKKAGGRVSCITHLQSDGTSQTFPLRTIFSWHSAPQDLLFAADEDRDASYERYLGLTDEACALLCLSPTFNAAVKSHPALENHPIGFAPMSLKTFGLFAPHEAQKIQLASHMVDRTDGPAGAGGRDFIPWIIAHELRHGVQHLKGPFFPGALNIRDVVLHSRVNEADSCAFQTTVAWELQALGHEAPWRTLISRPKYGPIARAFYACAAQDPASVNSGMAANAAFRAWFASRSLRGIYDRGACKPVAGELKMLAAHWPHMDPAYRILKDVRPLDDYVWRTVLRARSAMPYVQTDGRLADRPHYLNPAIANATLAAPARSVTDKRPLRRIDALTESLRAMATDVRPVKPDVYYAQARAVA